MAIYQSQNKNFPFHFFSILQKTCYLCNDFSVFCILALVHLIARRKNPSEDASPPHTPHTGLSLRSFPGTSLTVCSAHKWVAWISLNNLNGLATAHQRSWHRKWVGNSKSFANSTPHVCTYKNWEQRRQYEIPWDNKMTNLWHDCKASVCVFSFEIGLPK